MEIAPGIGERLSSNESTAAPTLVAQEYSKLILGLPNQVISAMNAPAYVGSLISVPSLHFAEPAVRKHTNDGTTQARRW